jgi:hypothetical protein
MQEILAELGWFGHGKIIFRRWLNCQTEELEKKKEKAKGKSKKRKFLIPSGKFQKTNDPNPEKLYKIREFEKFVFLNFLLLPFSFYL